jgi:drug/metabolite transporter (DMT)-like permease
MSELDDARAAAARRRGVLLALVSAASFSTLGLFARLVYSEGFSVPQALAWRFTVAAAILWTLVGASARKGGTPRKPLGRKMVPVLLLGILGFAPQAGLYFVTLRFLDPGITSLLLYLYPSFVILLAFAVLGRKPNRIQVISLALSLTGCAITFFKPGNYPLVGLALGLLVAVTYAGYLVASDKVLSGVDPIRATAVIMLAAAAIYWIIAAATGPLMAPTSLASIAGILGMAVFATVLAITTLFASMGAIGASDTSLFSTVEPVLTVVLSAILLGERLGPAQTVGGALIIAAVVILRFAPASGAAAPRS